MDLRQRNICATARGLWKVAEKMRGSDGKSKMCSLNLYVMVCVMLVCCAEDRGEEQPTAWILI
jgi:hypothetical protein